MAITNPDAESVRRIHFANTGGASDNANSVAQVTVHTTKPKKVARTVRQI